ncbi:MAG TPA: hypothetical protein VHW70_04970 [Edaphobacter sp.]|nr:hypothetical protein [Edaphobacter sp.]
MISRRTIGIFGFVVFLFAIPQAYYAVERADCHANHSALLKEPTQPSEAEVTFDVCSMTDFGMYPWMRYSFLGAFVALLATAISYRSDRRNTYGSTKLESKNE